MKLKEPTGKQCDTNAALVNPDGYDSIFWRAFAYWYPQMGGYTSRCVVVIPREENGCFEVYVWHNGEFPFSEDEGIPAHIHHCEADQFIRLGEFVKSKMEQLDVSV